MTSYVLLFYFANIFVFIFYTFTCCKKSAHCLRAEPAFCVYLRLFACGISNNLLSALIGLKVCAKSWLKEGACTSRSLNQRTDMHTQTRIYGYIFVCVYLFLYFRYFLVCQIFLLKCRALCAKVFLA